MNKIKLLDNLTIEKIAAGEVIERPASIVKELIENSLDAKASNIVIEINNGGKTFIRVTDNGDGIDPKDVDLAFKRHSTSKLSRIEDIYDISSLGFRGEALASVSNVAKVEMLTKTEGSTAGIQALVEEGEILSKNIIGCPKGTTMIVRDLFYNLPVRRKFLRTDLVETNHISDIVSKLALGNYKTSFKFLRDNKVVLNTGQSKEPLDNIYSILGKDIASNLIEINYNGDFNLRGYISNNKLYRSNRSHQYIYINGRYIVNSHISTIIGNEYKSFIPINRFPVFILFFDISPSDIDVNIHPTKQEVKFVHQRELMDSLKDIINEQLSASFLIPKMDFKVPESKNKVDPLPLLFENIPTEPQVEYKELKNSPLMIEEFQEDIVIHDLTAYNDKNKSPIVPTDIRVDTEYDDFSNILSRIHPIGIVFNTYIIVEDRIGEKIYFIDQHAAHERIMYEKFLYEYKREDINIQPLLMPEIIQLTSLEMNKVMDNLDIFRSLGFDLEEFGLNTIAIRGVPMIFGEPQVKSLFLELLDNIDNNIQSNYELKIDKIMKIACTKSVKSGDKLGNIEVDSLIQQLRQCNSPQTCPHGRPTLIEMNKRDIEKRFLRIE